MQKEGRKKQKENGLPHVQNNKLYITFSAPYIYKMEKLKIKIKDDWYSYVFIGVE